MKMTFENLGAMDSAAIELASLTVICGENNTGKTYVTYATYALLEAWRHLTAWQISENTLSTLKSDGSVTLNLQDELVSQWETIKQNTSIQWKKFLPAALAAPESRFEHTVLSFDFELDNRWLERPFEAERLSEQGKVVFSAKKVANSPFLEIAALRDPSEPAMLRYALEDFVREVILESVFGAYISRVFMASAERTGATIFKDELNLTKNKIVGLLAQLDKDKTQHITPNALFAAVYKQGYALPINHNVRFVNTLSQLEGRPSSLIKAHPELLDNLKTIAGGNYKTNSDGLTVFIPQGTKAKLSLTEASSAARSLLVLWYWLIGEASVGDILMIDEPEMNLHPANQRRMARWIARLVNCGVRVFVTTHSDYIVKELNTLIMFNQRTQAIHSIATEQGYSDEEFLNPEHVRLYVCKEDYILKRGNKNKTKGMTLIQAEKSVHLGLEVSTFDTTIDSMNDLQDRLYYAPADSEEKKESV